MDTINVLPAQCDGRRAWYDVVAATICVRTTCQLYSRGDILYRYGYTWYTWYTTVLYSSTAVPVPGIPGILYCCTGTAVRPAQLATCCYKIVLSLPRKDGDFPIIDPHNRLADHSRFPIPLIFSPKSHFLSPESIVQYVL